MLGIGHLLYVLITFGSLVSRTSLDDVISGYVWIPSRGCFRRGTVAFRGWIRREGRRRSAAEWMRLMGTVMLPQFRSWRIDRLILHGP